MSRKNGSSTLGSLALLGTLTVLAACGSDSMTAGKSIAISSPAAGSTVTLGTDADKSANVAYTVTGFTLKAPGQCAGAADCGHVHLCIDAAACSQGGPYNNDSNGSPAVAKFAKCPTATGMHTIKLELHNDDHSIYMN